MKKDTIILQLKGSIDSIKGKSVCINVDNGVIFYPIYFAPKNIKIGDKVHIHPENFIKKNDILKSPLINEYNRKVLLPFFIESNVKYQIGNDKIHVDNQFNDYFIKDITYLFGKVVDISNGFCSIDIEEADIVFRKENFIKPCKRGLFYKIENGELEYDKEATNSFQSATDILKDYVQEYPQD